MKDLKEEVLNLIGKIVTYKRIAGNTIILYFDGKPGETNTKSIWIDPAWRYERHKKYIVGSEDFPWEQEDDQNDEEYSKNFEKICERTNSLIGAKVVEIKIGELFNDICLFFSNHQVIRNMFTSENTEGWVYRDHSKNLVIVAFVDYFKKNRDGERSPKRTGR